jgi:Fic family protein
MRAAGYTVQEQNPFDEALNVTFGVREVSPYVNRLRLTWEKFREDILLHFPKAPEEAINPEELLRKIDVIYTTDAYHSLSIEGYHVSAGLIDQARSGNWNPEGRGEDKEHVNALAARGYWQAFQAVKKTILETINGKDAATAAENDFQEWYRELFGPSVAAGIIEAADLAGYRNRPVYIRRSMHTPPNSVAVLDLMPAYFEHLRNEKSPEVRVVLAHFIFVYIHPYVDGNGRMGRFLMNLMLSSSGYSWLVIPVERRDEYMESLEAASVHQDIVPFTKFLASLMK